MVPLIFLVVFHSALAASTIDHPLVVRDHLAGSSREVQIQARLHDSTGGSWVGTRPGIDGLPTPALDRTGPSTGNRHVLQRTNAPPGWPGRIALRLDFMNILGDFGHECSGILVGPKHALTAAHCVNWRTYERIDQGWVSDSFYVRPGFDRGRDLPDSAGTGRMEPVRVVKSWVSRSVFDLADQHGFGYAGDDDWALLELERDVGTQLGWAAVGPLEPGAQNRYYHMLSYPSRALCLVGEVCDTVSRSDSLSHSWGPVDWDPFQEKGGWTTFVAAWGGESGAALLDCEQSHCRAGKAVARATRWSTQGISALDSVMSGVLAKLLEGVKVPVADLEPWRPAGSPRIEARWEDGFWTIPCPRAVAIEVFRLDGTRVEASRVDGGVRLASGRAKVLLVVARGPGWSQTRTLVAP